VAHGTRLATETAAWDSQKLYAGSHYQIRIGAENINATTLSLPSALVVSCTARVGVARTRGRTAMKGRPMEAERAVSVDHWEFHAAADAPVQLVADGLLTSDHYRLLVDSVIDYAIIILDPDGNVASWNAGAEAIKGYRADEIVGRHFSVFYSAEAIKRGFPAEELRNAAANDRFEDEGWRVRKDGSQFWANGITAGLWLASAR
jgi:PAS domain S-box-containing protein